ncbi:hypothetical protein PFICI_01574 [Pestalotiopsis fici W106-1]|uniref:Uncharacterized protein n=1 Tax=Pestalotiopsis fici (strain W106-1 / CGMCC3.15140) TaxID=1229662 RepID=W3XRC2_PESFW|nr:uncharacterized protein PFICI_01574 [Pestalotiopsis fici W106-1]ETS87746.1 hypothetical protein PFICI_01574 [Pestalotiopsis fici W106-1]
MAAVMAGVEAIAILSDTTSSLLKSTSRRRGCGRLPSSSASELVSVNGSFTTFVITLPESSPTTATTIPETTAETTTSTSLYTAGTTASSTESSAEVSSTFFAIMSSTDSTTIEPTLAFSPTLIGTESTIGASTTAVSTFSVTEPALRLLQ